MLRRFVPVITVLLLFGFVVASLSTSVHAQDEAGRDPLTLDFFMSDQPTENGTGATDTIFQLVNGTTGTAGSANSGCSAGAANGVIAEWVSTPVWEYPATILNVSAVTLGIGPGPGLGGSPVGAPQAVTTGPGEITLSIAAGEAANHDIASGSAQIDGPAPGAPTGIKGSYTITPEVAGGGAHPANMPIIVRLSVSCANAASFSVSGGAVSINFVYGAPTDPDSDGDGIPDALDPDDDNDSISDEDELAAGSDPRDQTLTPQSESAICPGYTYQEVVDETGDPNTCPVEGGIPWLLIVLVALVVVLLAGGGAGAFVVVNKKIKMTVSHDGFQAIEKGQAAEYELTLIATGKKEEEIPVELTLKGVPEEWSASLEPSHMTLLAGEAAEAQTAILRLTPPPGEEYESEAQVVVTATPTDEEGKTSAMKPGTSVKTKSIVNIGVTPPEGEGKKKKPKKEKKAEAEEGSAEAGEEGGKKKGFGGMLKRKKKGEEEETPAEEEAEEQAAEAASEEPAAGAAAAAPASPPATGKPSVAMGKMVHDPADFSAGDDVTTTVAVRNKGDGPVEGLTLSLYVNDQRADQKSVNLGPGDSEEVVFHWTAQPDENRVKLKGSMKGA